MTSKIEQAAEEIVSKATWHYVRQTEDFKTSLLEMARMVLEEAEKIAYDPMGLGMLGTNGVVRIDDLRKLFEEGR